MQPSKPKGKHKADPGQQVVSFVGPSCLLETTFDPLRQPPLKFAVLKDGKVQIVENCTLTNGVVVVPPADRNGLVAKGVVLLPSCATAYGSQESLIAEIRAFIHRYADVPDFWEELIAHYILMTWAYDRFSAVPYLRFLGEPQSGKTRCLQVASHIAYRAIVAGGATTASPMFRLLEMYHGTFIIDEADYKNSDLWSETIKILNCGYARGMPVLRSDKNGDSYEPRAFDVFGPKILTTRREFEDHALETRCITVHTEERRLRREIPRQLPPKFYAESFELRNKLLQWRFENYHRITCDESKLLELDPRLTQIGTPIYSVASDPGFRERFLRFLSEQSEEHRGARPQAVIVEAIRQLVADGKKKLPAMLSIKELAERTDCVVENGQEGFSAKRTGSLLRGLGFLPARTRDGYQFELTEVKLKELSERYPSET